MSAPHRYLLDDDELELLLMICWQVVHSNAPEGVRDAYERLMNRLAAQRGIPRERVEEHCQEVAGRMGVYQSFFSYGG